VDVQEEVQEGLQELEVAMRDRFRGHKVQHLAEQLAIRLQ
jgi:hypothetical protein